MATLGQFVKERRQAKEWSKRKLAIEAGISHTEVHRIENGERQNPSVPVLNALAEALGVAKEEMLQAAGYIDEQDQTVSLIEKVFPDLKTEVQRNALRKIVDGLARNADLEEGDAEDLVRQTEMFLAYAKSKKNSKKA
ncbi:helix-turn-helix transcriptional regulator [Peptococcaceae bacterium 1198_IL3148]